MVNKDLCVLYRIALERIGGDDLAGQLPSLMYQRKHAKK
jgi:hypothetical protein